MTITIAQVLRKIDLDLEWRGPDDQTLRRVMLQRDHAQYLRDWAIRLINAKDEMELEIARLKKQAEREAKRISNLEYALTNIRDEVIDGLDPDRHNRQPEKANDPVCMIRPAHGAVGDTLWTGLCPTHKRWANTKSECPYCGSTNELGSVVFINNGPLEYS